MSVYKIFILLVFQREYAKSNVMISFRILSSFDYIVFMLLLKLPNRNTHVCTSSIRMISFFYPSVWIVHKLQCFKECQPCVRTDRERGEWSTKCGQAGTGGGGVPKIPKFVRTSFMNGPYWEDWYTKFFKQN